MGKRQQTDGSLAVRENNVIVIEAAKKPESEKLRVAAYCRVSSDSSDQMNSFMAQLNYYTALISGKDTWTLVDLYADAGISGTSAEKRPDFQRLLSDCRKGQIDKVLVKSISRFARNAKDCLETVRTLKAIGVGVYFEEQKAESFQCYHVDFYEEYLDINDEEYWALLESKREEITATILKCCKTKRSSIYLVGPIALDIAERFSVKRICDKENRHNIAYRFVTDIMDQLIEQGLLVTAKTTHGDGIRAATDKEKKALGLLPQQPDALGNMTMQGW